MFDITRAYGLTFLFPAADSAVGACLREYGEFARCEADLIGAYLTEFAVPGTFIDVGANLGAICLPVAKARPEWRIMAFEAHRGMAGVLAANALNNDLLNVEYNHAAVGGEAGIARFPAISLAENVNFGGMSMTLESRTATEPVRMCRLDDVAPTDTRFIKVDVEGFEPEVLRGASALLARQEVVWLLEAKRQDMALAQSVMQVLKDARYRIFLFFAPFVGGVSSKSGSRLAELKGDFNFLALPPGVPNIWNLPELDALDTPWPTNIEAYAYLAAYGFKF
ncbi:FkbM family methyltransferase [Phenylobacterium aquaticum]|uniref:FkbM family methyltransferase n=1 Tax=Phenylobacterium aquaticum TaxID=1763816 RepID=UPI0026F16299|nr:FkbM family methyltransferase [Phenylobacterium aquaticum]